ncbi:hypothetical protein NW762_005435 [Fusarium torreyae]|uniref:Uncharacterized protein n=1 Tax=Fusarium torreyae TaxID=1237075 RepID=A0A9W8S449_9HYPO|nr:hypothetical protein NW762_005435 [Fusarium torreyae]
MSGTAPNDPAPGGHSKGFEQTPLDSNQHGQAQNIIDETKDTGGKVVDANIGDSIDAGKTKDGVSSRVDDLLDQPGTASGNTAAERKASAVDEKGFKVGEEADLHGLASSKQP